MIFFMVGEWFGDNTFLKLGQRLAPPAQAGNFIDQARREPDESRKGRDMANCSVSRVRQEDNPESKSRVRGFSSSGGKAWSR
jgi:hypothetical protein